MLARCGLTSALSLAIFGCPGSNNEQPDPDQPDLQSPADMGADLSSPADMADMAAEPDLPPASQRCVILKKLPARFELSAQAQQLTLELQCDTPLNLSCEQAPCATLTRASMGDQPLAIDLSAQGATYIATIKDLASPQRPGPEAVALALPGLDQPLQLTLRWGLALDTVLPQDEALEQQLPPQLSTRRIFGLRLLALEQPLDPSLAQRAPLIALVSSEDQQRVELWVQNSDEPQARMIHSIEAPADALTDGQLHATAQELLWVAADQTNNTLKGIHATFNEALELVSARALTSLNQPTLNPSLDLLLTQGPDATPTFLNLARKDATTLAITTIKAAQQAPLIELSSLGGQALSASDEVGLLGLDEAGQPLLWALDQAPNKTTLNIASPQQAQLTATFDLDPETHHLASLRDAQARHAALILSSEDKLTLIRRDAQGQWSQPPLTLEAPKHITLSRDAARFKLLDQQLLALGAGPDDPQSDYAITWDLTTGKLAQVNLLHASSAPAEPSTPALALALDKAKSKATPRVPPCDLNAEQSLCLGLRRCAASNPPSRADRGLCVSAGTDGLQVRSANRPLDEITPQAQTSLGQPLWLSVDEGTGRGLSITLDTPRADTQSTHTLWTLDAQGKLEAPTQLNFNPPNQDRVFGAIAIDQENTWAIALARADEIVTGTFKAPTAAADTLTLALQTSPHTLPAAPKAPLTSLPPALVRAAQLTLSAPTSTRLTDDPSPTHTPIGQLDAAAPLLIAHVGEGCGALQLIALEGLSTGAPQTPREIATLDEATACDDQPSFLGFGRFFDEDTLSIVTYHPKARALRLSYLQHINGTLTLTSEQLTALEPDADAQLAEAMIGDWDGDGLDGIALRPRNKTHLVLIAHSGEGNITDSLKRAAQPPPRFFGVRDDQARQEPPSPPQLHATFPPSPLPLPTTGASGWLAVSAGGTHTCAIKLDQTIQCWGSSDLSLSPPAGTFTKLDAGENHDCALRTDGSAVCWGRNDEGQCNTPAGTFKQIAAGVEFSCGIRTDDTLDCWGLTPSATPAGTFKEVQAHSGNACAIRTDDTVVCWSVGNNTPTGPFIGVEVGAAGAACGLNAAGQASCWGGGYLSMQTPSPGTFTQLTAGDFHGCALRPDGSIACFGADNYGQATPPMGSFTHVTGGRFHTCALGVDQQITCWGDDSSGQSTVPTPAPVVWSIVDGGSGYSCARRTDGSLACWGSNTNGRATPPAGVFSALSSGLTGSCAIVAADQTLRCWGNQTTFQPLTTPIGQFTQLSVGSGAHSCGMLTNGNIHCWGQNTFGQLTPPAGTFKQVSAGGLHTCGIRTDDTLACWGQNANGALAAPAGTFSKVSSGRVYHSCAIRTDGTLACWGYNNYGQASPPTGTFIDVTVNEYSSCGLRADGSATCWGQLYAGLGNPPQGPFTAINSGPYHACAVRADGSAACWGDNGAGQCNVPQ